MFYEQTERMALNESSLKELSIDKIHLEGGASFTIKSNLKVKVAV